MSTSAPDEIPLDGSTYLLHCRPRLVFHLGHARMLNVLYKLLTNGRKVIVLIIPYDEHEPNNATIRRRLDEEIALTREFYRLYLGYAEPYLTIVSSREIDLDIARLQTIQKTYVDLYSDGNEYVRALIGSDNRRPWASPNILFVPKCIAAIENISPSTIIASSKHGLIANSFNAILSSLGVEIPFHLFSPLLDLRMRTPMDRKDSIDSYIDISEHSDFILHKLDLLQEEPEALERWLSHFSSVVLTDAPERARTGVGLVSTSTADKVIGLTRFIANVRTLVPYATQDKASMLRITWVEELYGRLSQEDQRKVERLATTLYSGTSYRSVSLYKIYSSGRSGSTVLGVRESEDEDGARISNLSVLKVGRAADLANERSNYRRFVEPRRTAVFMAVKPSQAVVGDVAAIAYEEANRFFGTDVNESLRPLHDLVRADFRGDASAAPVLHDLLVNHLYQVLYRHGTRRDRATIRQNVAEFLPASLLVRPNRAADNSHSVGTDPVSGGSVRMDLQITDSDIGRGYARGYTVQRHEKIDLDLRDLDEATLGRFVPQSKISINATVLSSRSNWFDQALGGISFPKQSDGAWTVAPGLNIQDPESHLERALAREYESVVESVVHGDLHASNVLWSTHSFGVIDYGSMRDSWPALYDVAFLWCDLKSRFFSEECSLELLAKLELGPRTARGLRFSRKVSNLRRLIDIFEYQSLPAEIRSLGSETLFHTLCAIIYFGRLKFSLPLSEKRTNAVLGECALRRVR